MVVSELDELLEMIRKRGFVMQAFRTTLHGPEIVAFTYDWGDVADVVILRGEDSASAFRTPTGLGADVLNPQHVAWHYHSSAVWTMRALLTLPPPDDPGAPNVILEVENIGIPTKGRMPVLIRILGR